jgi:molecular chaperone GrpE
MKTNTNNQGITMNDLDQSMTESNEPTQTGNDAGFEERDIVQELEEWKDAALRAKADFDNMRRRMMAREQELQQMAAERILRKILPIVDDLQHAVDAAGSSNDVVALVSGLTMILDKTHRILEAEGVTAIPADAGDQFDVDLHEALLSQPSEHPEGHIVTAIERGYKLHSRVLRHAKVITSTGADLQGTTE